MGLLLSIYMICWGIVVLSIGFANNWAQLMALRALQGLFECTISPGFILIIGTWYKTREHVSRSLVFQSANAGMEVISKLVMYGIGVSLQDQPGKQAWRYISYVRISQGRIRSGREAGYAASHELRPILRSFLGA